MMRMLLTVTAIAFLIGVFPAFAQSGGGCADWCRINRCSGGYTSGAAPKCMMALSEEIEVQKIATTVR